MLARLKWQEVPLLSSLSTETLAPVPVARWPHTDTYNLTDSDDV